MRGSIAAVLSIALCVGAAFAADGGGSDFDYETGGAAAAVGEVAERSLRSELAFCGGEAKDIAKATPKLMKDWRRRNQSWLSASLAVRADVRARLVGQDAANNGPIFDRNLEQSIAGVTQRGTDRLRAVADRAQRLTACRSLVADLKDGRRDVSTINEKATLMLRGYMK
jgi:hypothetical protein